MFFVGGEKQTCLLFSRPSSLTKQVKSIKSLISTPSYLFARRNFRKKNLLNCMFPNFEDTPRNGEKHSLQAKCPTPVGKTKNWRDRLWHFLQGLISRIFELAVQVCPNFPVSAFQPSRVVEARQPGWGAQLQWEVTSSRQLSKLWQLMRF